MIPTASEHPLPRDGTSQERRVPPGMDPARRLLDDRDLDDLLLQLRHLARFLTYFDLANQPRGTWEPFFTPHFAVRLAILAHQDAGSFRVRADELAASLQGETPDRRASAARDLFLLSADELASTDRELESLHQTAFGPVFERSVFSLLRPALLRLIAVARATPDPERARWLDPLRERLQNELWRVEINTVAPAADVSTTDEFTAALERALISLGEQLALFQERVAQDAATMLEAAALEDGQQPPHLGLLLAWLRLFRHAQDALNDLVRRHLEFYYGCQLRIPPQSAVPDRAFVVVEPARNTAEHLLPQDTRLYAGKDATKVEIQFGLVRDLLVNRAAVAELRSTYVDGTAYGLVRAAPVANSADGQGEALPEDSPSWAPFGHEDLPAGRLGLALAAPVLRLTGGTKSITASLQLANAARDTLVARCEQAAADGAPAKTADGEWPLDGLFAVALTAPKGWWSPDSANVQIRFAPDAETPVLRVSISSIAVDEAVSGYDAAVHGRAYDTAWPLLELTRNPPTAAQAGGLLDDLELAAAVIECQVTGDTNLVAANDYGTLDPAKPFQPFGASPSVNSSFYAGSAEIFSKQLSALSFVPKWKDLPADLGQYFSGYVPTRLLPAFTPSDFGSLVQRAQVTQGQGTSPEFLLTPAYLDGGTWRALATSSVLNLSAAAWTLAASDLTVFAAAPDLAPFATLTGDLVRGFVRFQLTSPDFAFGHQKYGSIVTANVVAAVKGAALTLPEPPLSPSLLRLEASYTARETRDLTAAKGEDDTLALFHIEPHGEWEITTARPTCVPSPPAHGTSFLGIDGLEGGQELALLFHLADGSGSPFETYPEIAWEYLTGNAWVALPSDALVADSTNTLRRTGVIVFGVPEDAATGRSRMPAGRIWLRATATGAVGALNRAYSVTAQAVEAVFVPNANDLSRLSVPLPAGSITRLITSQPQIRKVQQPLPSFDGQLAEHGERYYRRVSERLRHRQRAICLWDYERLVLQAFPELHKVKCIPHTSADSELAPGHVTVVLVPILAAGAYDPRRPAASQDLLAEVASFLGPLISAHVKLHVLNPIYEEVKVQATLVLRPGFTDTGFYQKQAAADLTLLLTPWVSGDQQTLAFDASLYPSTILNFLEEREYLDYVEDFHVRKFVGAAAVAVDPVKLMPTTERSLLVSAQTHDLAVLRAPP